MTVDNIYLLTYEDLAEHHRVVRNYIRVGRLRVHWRDRKMVNLEPVTEVSNSDVLLQRAGNYDDFVATSHQDLSHIIHVHFDASEVRHEEVADKRYVQSMPAWRSLNVHITLKLTR